MSAGRLGVWLRRATIAGMIGAVVAVAAGGSSAFADDLDSAAPSNVVITDGPDGSVASTNDYTWD